MGLEGGCGTWRKKNIKVVKIFTIYVQTLPSREVISVQNGLVSCKIYKKWAKHTQRRVTYIHTHIQGRGTHTQRKASIMVLSTLLDAALFVL